MNCNKHMDSKKDVKKYTYNLNGDTINNYKKIQHFDYNYNGVENFSGHINGINPIYSNIHNTDVEMNLNPAFYASFKTKKPSNSINLTIIEKSTAEFMSLLKKISRNE